ncbi:MAG: hypothetical protein SO471_17720 [Anaerobutyricum hallii]|uniref:hypothetical protein n=1 Tax=Anaerobutyricum hallii TaxID=39488 RepID=UPI002A7FE396|nr:hypothetical protein [Anaerobutyricum hallii]MDY4579742.1 hypothetical protein [Anaerobutyricum hallii]
MKVINKILCFLSVLVLCVPLLCFNVSADSSDLTYEEFFLSGGTGDLSGIEILSVDENKQVSVPDNYFALTILNEKVALFDLTDSFSRFRCSFSRIFYYFKDSNDDNRDIYYIFRYGKRSDDYYYMTCHISFSPMSLDSNNKIISDSEVFASHIEFKDFPTASTCTWRSTKVYLQGGSNRSTSSSNVLLCSDYVNSNCTFSDIQEVYSNCILEYNGNKVSERPKSSALKDNIEVKLTPDFGLDMDRIDPLTNQSDYFKFEITNNSDSAIQWCAGIYDPELITADTMDILNLSSWAYVSRTTYYDFSVKEDKGIFRTTYTYSGVLKTGSFDYHYLQPGETFSDLIFWENINIKPNVIYHFFVNAVKTDLNYSSLNIDPPVTEESSDMHSVTVIEDTYYNTILEGASSFRKLDCNIFNIEFSCLSMPAFTTTVRGGNSVLNTSGNDRHKLYNNFETVSDINGLDTKINKNYTDPAILANSFNRSDVSVDIDSFSVDDVKSYITSCQSFFILIKEALLSFPAFIWALICFGLTGLIVIAVVKALL